MTAHITMYLYECVESYGLGTEYKLYNIKCLTALILTHLWGMGRLVQLNSQLKVIYMKKKTVVH
jgi:hypothetical protein